MNVRRNLNGPYPRGVVNPYTAHVHPYSTRYHGAIFTRPVFGLPYVRSPHAVFKPDDFSDFYEGTQGLGSFGGGSSIGGNTLGLGATGTPIYYLAASSNPKVVKLQEGLNRVANSQGYKQLPVTGKLDALTCAALALLSSFHPDAFKAEVDAEIAREAAHTCNIASQNSVVKNQVIAQAQKLKDTRNFTPAATAVPTPVVVAPSVAPAPTTQAITTAPVPESVVVEEEAAEAVSTPAPTYTPAVLDFPEMQVEARPSDKSYGKMPLLLGAVAIGGLYYLLTKK